MMADGPLMVVTIARQLGAGGAPLGKRLAERLGFAYYDDEILRLAAKKLGAEARDLARWDEHRAAFWEKLGLTLSLGAPAAMYTPLNAVPVIHDREVFELQAQVMKEVAARESCVIIGRAGFWVLREHPGRVSVYLHAAPEKRLGAVMGTFKVDEKKARELIARVDTDRARFVRETTGSEITATSQHLCIDTGVVSMEGAEEMVVRAVEDLRRRLAAG